MKKVVLMLAIIGLVGVAGASKASAGVHIGIHFPAPQVVIRPTPNVVIVAQPAAPQVIYQPPVVYHPAPVMYPAPRGVQPHCAPVPVRHCNHRYHGHSGCREMIIQKHHNKHHRHFSHGYGHDHGDRRYFAGR